MITILIILEGRMDDERDMKDPIVTVRGDEKGPFGFHMIGPSAPTETNKDGGKQSVCPVRLDLVPAEAMYDLGLILSIGSKKYGDNNWKKIPVSSHVNKAIVHLYAFLAGDTNDNHLGHAMCRAMMAHQLDMEDGGMNEVKANQEDGEVPS